MFIGAMIMAPLAALHHEVARQPLGGQDQAAWRCWSICSPRAIWGFVMAIVGFYPLAWIVNGIMNILSAGVHFLVESHLLPLTSIIIEPAKVFFLNNAINQRRADPLGLSEAAGPTPQLHPVPA